MFSLKYWRQDAQASLVVFLVALPLCLGIALASGAPLASGLIAGIVGGIIVGSSSGSSISVSGPAAGLTVIVFTAIQDLGSFEAFTLAVFLSGIFQIIFGALRGGVIGNYFPTAVIKGMLAAIGIILILKQLPHAVGYDADFMGDEAFGQTDGENTFSEVFVAFNRFHLGAIFLSLTSIFIMLGWEKAAKKGNKFFKLIPGALVAVITAVVLNQIFKTSIPDLFLSNSHLVQLPFSGFSDLVAGIRLPEWGFLGNFKVYGVALTIAIVGSLESLLSIEAGDKIDTKSRVTSKNRELFAQGLGNAVSGFIGGIPVTAVIVRTSANVTAGAQTKLSTVLHGLWLFLCVATIPHVLNLIPLSALAAILLLVGYKLAKPELIQDMYKKGMGQFIPFAATIVAILFTDLLVGIMVGMLVGFVFVIRRNMHKSIVLVNDEDLFLIRFHKDATFLQKTALLSILEKIPDNSNVLIDGSSTLYIDEDIVEVMEDFVKRAPQQNISVSIKKSTLALSPFFKEVSLG